ncbi:hypothetical protein ACFQO7_29445 [Catellatospora aurea]|uniref:Uncharacterized protein n=1 Tax=Catellatospora aurea TaxID=1337874 RepID=A0ABW2H5Q8_9ACTN
MSQPGSAADLAELVEQAKRMPESPCRQVLIEHACAGPGLPADVVAVAREALRRSA